MSEQPTYDRSAHEASCPCNLCVGFDILYAKQEGLRAEYWQPNGLAQWLQSQRQLKLNWDLPAGHCLLCGGTNINSWFVSQHYEIHRYNEKEVDGKFYTSLMIHKKSPMFAVYMRYVKREGGFGKEGPTKAYQTFKVWACNMLDLLPEKCLGFASREHDEWIELRLGFTELVEETREQRINKYAGR